MAEAGRFREVLRSPHFSYTAALEALVESEDRRTRGYTMARTALGYTGGEGNSSYVQISDAVKEILGADNAGVLKPPLSEEFHADLEAYAEHEGIMDGQSRHPHAGIGAHLLSLALTHYHEARQVAEVPA